MSTVMDIVQRRRADARSDRGDVRTDTLIEIAVLYYYDNITQETLSRRFAMSRAKIGRPAVEVGVPV